jgi:amino acid adenylation domain-containing protein
MPTPLFPLTLTQNDIYIDQLRHDHSPLYNVGGYVALSEIDTTRLADAHKCLVNSQDIFGLRMLVTENGVVQCLSPARTSLPVLDFSAHENPVDAADEWQKSIFETALDVTGADLFRAYLVKVTDAHYRYIGIAHHLMMDGWGFSNWAKLLCQLYNDPFSVPDGGGAWRDVALDDATYAASDKYKSDKDYWSGHIQQIPVPLLHPRYEHAFGDAARVPSRRRIIDISRADFNELQAFAASRGTGIVQYMLAVLAVYFANSLEQEKVVFGLPFHNRRNHRDKKRLGVLVNIGPLRIEIAAGECTFDELLQNISRQMKANLRHQRYPLGHIIRDLAGPGDRRSLYDVAFNYLKLSGDLPFGGENASLVYLSHNHEATPLMVTLCEHGECGPVQLQLDYNLSYFNDTDALLLSKRLSFLSRSLRTAYSLRIRDLESIPEAEVRQLVEGFGDKPLHAPSSRCIHQIFEEQVRRVPNAVAVSSGKKFLTYKELNVRANAVAHYLIGRGVKPESLVGIYMERSVDVLIGVLGILKAGGAYVPLDQSCPQGRIINMLEDGGIHLVMTHYRLAQSVSLPAGIQVIPLEDIPTGAVDHSNNPVSVGLVPSNLAYVIHTSGSTGKPKGVQICHQSAVALLEWVNTIYTVEELDKVLASTSLGFDLSVFEMFAPLSVGGQCVMVRDALDLLVKPIDVTIVNTVPSAIKVLIEQNAIRPGTAVINLAGEPLPMHVVNDLLASQKCRKVFNLYGPSEDTTYSTYAVFTEVIRNAPNIGRAISGTLLYILSRDGKLVPTGVIGELHIAGSGLARGYLNNPDLTAEKFIPDPFSRTGGERLYKTGDLVRYGEDGVLEYVGRLDHQVKIRGFRIELEEVERQLERLNEVKTAVVLARESDALDKYLAAYLERKRTEIADGTETSDEMWTQGLLHALRDRLPGYMVPASITVLNEMPLTPNGKADKKALMALTPTVMPRSGYVAPETATEIKLAGLWAHLLGVDGMRVGATTSFFDLGGHSLLLIRLGNDIRSLLGIAVPMRVLFGAKDLRDLAGKIDTEATLQMIQTKMESSVIVTEGYM